LAKLLDLSLKNGFFEKNFDRAPPKEQEPQPGRSPAKQALTLSISNYKLGPYSINIILTTKFV
jgi:hypothetical protein